MATDGSVWCWGSDASGKLGCGGCGNSNVPVTVQDLPAASTLVCGGHHACAHTATGEVFCWGEDADGQVGAAGDGPHATAQQVTVGGTPFTADVIGVGQVHSLAIVGGQVYGWGHNGSQQLGNDLGAAEEPVATEVDLASIDGGGRFTCGVDTAGGVICWGRNHVSQTGLPNGTCDPCTRNPVSGLETGTVSVKLGGTHACALTDLGEVYCWGDDNNLRLGCDGCGESAVPVPVQGLN